MREAVPPLPRYTFMAWCSLKAQGHYCNCEGYVVPYAAAFVPLRNFGPINLMLRKRSMDNKKIRYQQNYSLRNEIPAKKKRLNQVGSQKK
jgi:hypothetical protein